MADIWETYGVNALDIWDLPAIEFYGMAQEIDSLRREAKKPR